MALSFGRGSVRPGGTARCPVGVRFVGARAIPAATYRAVVLPLPFSYAQDALVGEAQQLIRGGVRSGPRYLACLRKAAEALRLGKAPLAEVLGVASLKVGLGLGPRGGVGQWARAMRLGGLLRA